MVNSGMTHVETPQSRCRAALARADITPPVGIYHRMWGAALHDRATGVHRPLLATALWLLPLDAEDRRAGQLILALDHCILDRAEFDRLRLAAGAAVGIDPSQVQVCLSHTHGSGWMSRSRADQPGGELIGPYLDSLAETCAKLALDAANRAESATIVYGTGRCNLATERDFLDEARGGYVCGFNPAGAADDTVLVARVSAADGRTLGTVVNYACHPTTLAWQNTSLSPDYVGAMRELVERETGGPCLFLQGASGDLGPREGFVGDTAVADRNGRQLGYAALAAIEALPPPGTHFVYTGAVLSGATLGTWRHEPLAAETLARQAVMQVGSTTVELPYLADLPTVADTERELAACRAAEAVAVKGDPKSLSDARARTERMTRQLARLSALPAGKRYPFPITLMQFGDALWVFTPGELYQDFQLALRREFPERAIIVATITNDWQPGYVPAARAYGHDIYQAAISPLAQGCLETLVAATLVEVRSFLSLSSAKR